MGECELRPAASNSKVFQREDFGPPFLFVLEPNSDLSRQVRWLAPNRNPERKIMSLNQSANGPTNTPSTTAAEDTGIQKVPNLDGLNNGQLISMASYVLSAEVTRDCLKLDEGKELALKYRLVCVPSNPREDGGLNLTELGLTLIKEIGGEVNAAISVSSEMDDRIKKIEELIKGILG
jgi:hypothetical protein